LPTIPGASGVQPPRPLSFDVSKPHVIEVRHGGLYPPGKWGNRVQITLDGVSALNVADHTYDAAPETVTPLENRIGGSSTAATFTGKVVSIERLRD
jgi:hypothetical protein